MSNTIHDVLSQKCIILRFGNESDELLEAIFELNVEALLLLIAKGVNINMKYEKRNYNTPLHLAILKNEINIIQILVNNGANVSARNALGSTPLHTAIMEDVESNIILLLIINGCNVDETDDFGKTPLHYACMNKNVTNVNLLLEHNADPNIVCNYFTTPLSVICEIICESAVVNIFNALLEQGADINYCRIEENINSAPTALLNAISINNKSIIIKLIMQGVQLDLKNYTVSEYFNRFSNEIDVCSTMALFHRRRNEPIQLYTQTLNFAIYGPILNQINAMAETAVDPTACHMNFFDFCFLTFYQSWDYYRNIKTVPVHIYIQLAFPYFAEFIIGKFEKYQDNLTFRNHMVCYLKLIIKRLSAQKLPKKHLTLIASVFKWSDYHALNSMMELEHLNIIRNR